MSNVQARWFSSRTTTTAPAPSSCSNRAIALITPPSLVSSAFFDTRTTWFLPTPLLERVATIFNRTDLFKACSTTCRGWSAHCTPLMDTSRSPGCSGRLAIFSSPAGLPFVLQTSSTYQLTPRCVMAIPERENSFSGVAVNRAHESHCVDVPDDESCIQSVQT